MKTKNGANGATPTGPCVGANVGASRMVRSRANRRNTMDCAILNEIFVDDDTKHTDKRSKHLQRESERDIKRASMALTGQQIANLADIGNGTQMHLEERSESMPTFMRNPTNVMAAAPLLVSFFLVNL